MRELPFLLLNPELQGMPGCVVIECGSCHGHPAERMTLAPVEGESVAAFWDRIQSEARLLAMGREDGRYCGTILFSAESPALRVSRFGTDLLFNQKALLRWLCGPQHLAKVRVEASVALLRLYDSMRALA